MAEGSGIVERLDGAHVVLTGVTGFVGEALLHRLLADVPGCRATVVVRPRGATSGADRIRSLLGKPIFTELGDVDTLSERVTVLEGDMADVPALPTDTDAVVHCAGDVSFNPPVDQAFVTNVVGARGLLARIEEIREAGDREVHYVHVSTAYVAGRRRGVIPEGPVPHEVDVEAELAWGLAQRERVDHESRSREGLADERAKAEKEHGRAGLLTAAAATEEKRKEWVKDELIRLGTERARSLGWTDCYTFTKALGERVVEAYAGQGRTVTIVRPSIIESALEKPHVGWIEGFKMAEPLILAYGRGELPEFPGAADNVADIVPVDHVVAATVAVLANPPEPGAAAYFHVTSGDRNPFTFRALYDYTREYFDHHPFESGDRGAARLPDWRFPGARSAERLLSTSERAHKVADYVIGRAPRSDRARDLARKLDQQGRRLEFLRRYLDLYQEYLSADLRFSDANTQALFASLSDDDRERFWFDTAIVDWKHYFQEVHCPAVTAPVRAMDEIRRKRKRPDPGRLSPVSGEKVAAFFDMDGTLLSSNVVETFLWLRLQELSPAERASRVGQVGLRLPSLLRAERSDRTDFLRAMYRDYKGARLDALDDIVDEVLAGHVLGRLSPAAIRRVREHRAAGHPTVLITGAIRPLTRPLAPLFDHIESADLAVDGAGVCTGELATAPLTGESRAAWMRRWAQQNDVDLSKSYAYADSHSDLPLLAAVGRPVAVRPDVSLYRHARRHRWQIVDWPSPDSTARALNPAGAAR